MAKVQWIGSGYETAVSDRYVRLTRSAALEAAQSAGIESVRVLADGGGALTLDLRPDRLDLLVEEGIVVAAGFF